MATLRNLAIGLIRRAGHNRIAATIRKIKHDPHLLLAILGLKHPMNSTNDFAVHPAAEQPAGCLVPRLLVE
jgi:hypothetical protein